MGATTIDVTVGDEIWITEAGLQALERSGCDHEEAC